MCQNCGYNICNCVNPMYTQNWFNIDNYPCNPCNATEICKKTIPSQCVGYDGVNLSNINLIAPTNLKAIVQKIDSEIGNLKSFDSTLKSSLQTILNDINDRLNALEGGTPHDPYTL